LQYALGSSFTIRITHMKGEEIFGSYKQKSNLLSKLKGIHINTIMSTPRMENHMCKLSGLLIVFLTMKLWMNGKLHVQIEWPFCIVHHNEVMDEWKITCANWVAFLHCSSQWDYRWMENHMCKLSGPFVAFITMKLRISPMEVLRSWKLLVEIKFDI
jgi:hypothetical protein